VCLLSVVCASAGDVTPTFSFSLFSDALPQPAQASPPRLPVVSPVSARAPLTSFALDVPVFQPFHHVKHDQQRPRVVGGLSNLELEQLCMSAGDTDDDTSSSATFRLSPDSRDALRDSASVAWHHRLEVHSKDCAMTTFAVDAALGWSPVEAAGRIF
jgi:hypothetical protein